MAQYLGLDDKEADCWHYSTEAWSRMSLNSKKGPTGGDLVCNVSQSGPESIEAGRKLRKNFKYQSA